MKKHRTRSIRPHRPASCPAYPGAADPAYFLGKALEVLTAIGTGVGIVSAMVFLVILA